MSASATENIVAPPIPCRPRAMQRNVADPLTPQRTDPNVKIVMPIAKRRRRPKRSASDPVVSSIAASANA